MEGRVKEVLLLKSIKHSPSVLNSSPFNYSSFKSPRFGSPQYEPKTQHSLTGYNLHFTGVLPLLSTLHAFQPLPSWFPFSPSQSQPSHVSRSSIPIVHIGHQGHRPAGARTLSSTSLFGLQTKQWRVREKREPLYSDVIFFGYKLVLLFGRYFGRYFARGV